MVYLSVVQHDLYRRQDTIHGRKLKRNPTQNVSSIDIEIPHNLTVVSYEAAVSRDSSIRNPVTLFDPRCSYG
jgi:hypothetical protein